MCQGKFLPFCFLLITFQVFTCWRNPATCRSTGDVVDYPCCSGIEMRTHQPDSRFPSPRSSAAPVYCIFIWSNLCFLYNLPSLWNFTSKVKCITCKTCYFQCVPSIVSGCLWTVPSDLEIYGENLLLRSQQWFGRRSTLVAFCYSRGC